MQTEKLLAIILPSVGLFLFMKIFFCITDAKDRRKERHREIIRALESIERAINRK
jgi:hypothetical protein